MKTTLSIVIPAYNVQKYIARTLFSILAQNSSQVEIIIVNDGSNDQTEQVVSGVMENSDNRNVALYSNTNGGVSSARNFGMERANGEFVYFLDGDDYVADDFIGSILDLVERHKPQIMHWPYDLVDETGGALSRFPYRAELTSNKTGLETLDSILRKNETRVWTGSIAYRRDFLMQNKIRYTAGCTMGEDLEFIFKSLSYANSVLFTGNLRTYYVQRPASVSSAYSIRKFDAVLALERVRDHFLRLNTPEYLSLAEHFDEYEILHYYTGTYRMCLQYLISENRMRASIALNILSSEIDQFYPGLRERVSTMMNSRRRKLLPDRIDVFRISPILYLHLSRLNDRVPVLD